MSESNGPRRGGILIRFTPGSLEPDPDGDAVAQEANAGPAWFVAFTERRTKEDLGTYELWHPLTLEAADALKIFAIGERLPGLTLHRELAQPTLEQLRLMMPDAPPTLLDRLSLPQVYELHRRAHRRPWEPEEPTAANPPAAAGEPSGTSSPPPPAPSAGATES